MEEAAAMEKKGRIRFFSWIAMTAVFLAFAGGAAAETVEKRFEDLVLRYGARTEARAGAAEYRHFSVPGRSPRKERRTPSPFSPSL